jgi:AraC-like DNA-binding protein
MTCAQTKDACSPFFDCGRARLPPSSGGRSASSPTNRSFSIRSSVSATSSWPRRCLPQRLPVSALAALQNVLTGHLADTDPLIDTAVTRAIGMMRRHPDRLVSSLAVAVDLSERQLRRRFETAVGYGPKRFGRILRFQRLLDLVHTRGARIRWAELAVEAHYADQPHMINECLALAGMSPTALPAGMSVSSNTAAGDTS